MNHDRREELRRCDDACYRTRTSREIDELKERISALESLLGDSGARLVNYLSVCPSSLERSKIRKILKGIDIALTATEV